MIYCAERESQRQLKQCFPQCSGCSLKQNKLKIGDKVNYHVAIGEKSQYSKLVIEEFEIYKVTENTVWLRNSKIEHCVAYKSEIEKINGIHIPK